MARLSEQVSGAFTLAVDEAVRLDHRCWGSEHVMLALTLVNGEGEARGAEVLDQLGVTEGRMRGLMERHDAHMRRLIERCCPTDAERRGAAGPPPAGVPVQRVFPGYELENIATNTRWVAAYLGASLAGTEHLLLGTLWHEKPESKVLRDLGVTFEDAYRTSTGQEPPDEIRPLRPVYVSPPGDINALLRALREVLPAGASVSLGDYDDERAWFSARPETIELQDYMPQALELARKYR